MSSIRGLLDGRGSIAIPSPVRRPVDRGFPGVESLQKIGAQARDNSVELDAVARDALPASAANRVLVEGLQRIRQVAIQEGVPLVATQPPPLAVTSPSEAARNNESKLVVTVDSIETAFDEKGGVADGFFCKIRLLVSENDFKKLRAVRICRGETKLSSGDVVATSVLGISRLMSSHGRKNPVGIGFSEQLMSAKGQAGALGEIRVDPLRGRRGSSPSPITKNESAASSMNDVQRKISSFDAFSLTKIARPDLDPSVVDDLKTMSRIVSTVVRPVPLTESFSGRKFVSKDSSGHLGITREILDGSSKGTLALAGTDSFKEVFLATVGESNSRKIGDGLYELYFEDRSVTRGSRFTYYAILVDQDMKESRRSEVVAVVVDRQIPPPAPGMFVVGSKSGVSLSMRADSFLVERFEIYRRESIFLDGSQFEITVVKSGGGVSSSKTNMMRNGWVQLGEIPTGTDGTATFIDRRTVPGRTYEYRVYSVDSFGNKSCSPAIGSHHVAAPENNNDLKRPLITAEVDQGTKRIKVTAVSDDPRLSAIFISRKEISLKEKSFRSPHEPDVQVFGNVEPSRTNAALTNPLFFSKDLSWTGHFFVSGTGSVGFVDQTVKVDRSYQYVAYGVDRRGEKTSYDFSQPVFVSRDPLVDRPANFKVSLSSSSVKISWEQPNIVIGPDDVMGSQDRLADTAVRYMYQLQRKRFDGQSWDSFPLVKDLSFEDVISDEKPPRYRPKFARLGDTYLYRVATLQSGNLYSNYSEPIVVKVDPPPPAPLNLIAKSSDLRALPCYVVLSWDAPGAVVDRWEIERYATNNFFASNLILDEKTLSSLPFVSVGTVTLESSRSNARTADEQRTRDVNLFVGDKVYIDPNVLNGNTYIYRVTAVSPFGARSSPSYRGILLSNKPFELKSTALLDDDEVAELSRTSIELKLLSDRKK